MTANGGMTRPPRRHRAGNANANTWRLIACGCVALCRRRLRARGPDSKKAWGMAVTTFMPQMPQQDRTARIPEAALLCGRLPSMPGPTMRLRVGGASGVLPPSSTVVEAFAVARVCSNLAEPADVRSASRPVRTQAGHGAWIRFYATQCVCTAQR